MAAPQHQVVLYYQYVSISDVSEFAEQQLKICEQYELTGRVRVAEEGINGTLSGTQDQIQAYIDWMSADDRFATVDWKTSWSKDLPFRDLLVRIVTEIVSLEEDCDPSFGGTHLTPVEFHQVVEKEKQDTVVIDVRNTYEYNIGHFQDALNPETRRFGEFPKWVRQHREALQEKKNVLMYCTGGIRCEKASAFVKQLGVENVYQLRGGIHRYLEEFPDGGHFQGKNFVFDERVVQCSTDPTIVGRCNECGDPYDTISGIRCAYCRTHVLVCEKCQGKEEIFCSQHKYLEDPHSKELAERIEQLEEQIQKETGRARKSKRKSLKKQLEYLISRMIESKDGF